MTLRIRLLVSLSSLSFPLLTDATPFNHSSLTPFVNCSNWTWLKKFQVFHRGWIWLMVNKEKKGVFRNGIGTWEWGERERKKWNIDTPEWYSSFASSIWKEGVRLTRRRGHEKDPCSCRYWARSDVFWWPRWPIWICSGPQRGPPGSAIGRHSSWPSGCDLCRCREDSRAKRSRPGLSRRSRPHPVLLVPPERLLPSPAMTHLHFKEEQGNKERKKKNTFSLRLIDASLAFWQNVNHFDFLSRYLKIFLLRLIVSFVSEWNFLHTFKTNLHLTSNSLRP